MNLRRVVVVSSQDHVQKLARQIAQEVFVADDLAEAVDIAQTVYPDLVIFDDRFSPDHIRQFLDTTDKNRTCAPVIVVGDGENCPGLAEEFIRMGACDYLYGKQDYTRLEKIVSGVNDESSSDNSETTPGDFFIEDYAASVRIVGRSKAVQEKLRMIKLVAASRCNPVLIVGETGTGKELAAKAIHLLRHSNEQFIAVNCAALTANLLESELFGHVKGAFTGADREKTGLLELAGSGTIFLDEISEMPVNLQAKLLRVLQEKNFRKVGGTNTIACNATIIASSNRNLQKQIRAKRFRRDLYYRLNICPIIIAPLRAPERREDIKLLAEYFLKTSSICPEKAGRITSLTKLALEALQKHQWPGNVRELSNVIERAIMLETTDKIGLSSIMIDPLPYDESSDAPTANHVANFSLEKAERELITRALRETGWQKTRAAALLGITRATLYAKVKQYNIEKGLLATTNCGKQAQGEVSTTNHPEPVAVS